MLLMERPSPPASMPGAGECPGTVAPLMGRLRRVKLESWRSSPRWLVTCHLGWGKPLEDQQSHRHVTGLPPLPSEAVRRQEKFLVVVLWSRLVARRSSPRCQVTGRLGRGEPLEDHQSHRHVTGLPPLPWLSALGKTPVVRR